MFQPQVLNDPVSDAFKSITYGGCPPSAPFKRTTEPMVTTTSVLALKYDGGIVVAADCLASYGSLARFKDVRRLIRFGPDVLIGFTGEYSDIQEIVKLLTAEITRGEISEDGRTPGAAEIHSLLTRILYQRRNKMDPFWINAVVAGRRNEKTFLGTCDLQGTSFKEDILATGYGAYIAIPLLRNAWRENLTLEEAKKVIIDSMRVLYYRDARTINKIQVAVVNDAGVNVSEPFEMDTNWSIGESQRGYNIDGSW